MPDDQAPTGPLLLLDSASLYFRAFYGLPDSLRAPDGMPINAVRGLLDFITRLAGDREPDRIVACWDNDWRPEFRTELLPSYKEHRVVAQSEAAEEEVPDLLAPQVPVIQAVLPALGVPICGADGYEADDVIGSLASDAHGAVEVVSGDRDLFQLVDERVRVIYPARGVGRADVVDDEWLEAKYGVIGRQYADFATLRGDASDGLPGVRGIGEKTAALLLRQYGDLAGIQAAAADPASTMRPAARRSLLAAEDYLAVAPRVVAVQRELALTVPPATPDPDQLAELGQRYGIAGPIRRAAEALSGLSGQATAE